MRKYGIWTVVIGLCAAAVVVSGCQPAVGVACGPGWCSEVEICVDPDSVKSVCVRRTCGNGRIDEGEECDDGNNDSGDGCSRNCSIESCGNGVPDLNEQCEDGNAVGGDGCSENCTIEQCDNSIVDRAAGEQCDDGNRMDGDGCTAGCKLPSCGNGVVDPYEQCDDGNQIDGDGCSVNCTIEACGNGILDRARGEECDDRNTTDGDGCTAGCKLPSCGNGVVDPYEQCDDGNEIDGDGCSVHCTVERCDNRILDRAHHEQCDDGNTTDGDGCTARCELPSCGNGVQDPYEQCDDGNAINGDGCSADCTIERCGNGILDRARGEQCDDGNQIDGDGCTARCELPSCGNRIVDRPYEQCDDGNHDVGDGCSASCTIEVCGNGILDVDEECDDGNHRDGDGCSQRCAFESCGDGVVGPHEECDPRATPETCNLDCTLSQCGDAKVNRFAVPAEQCDDGNRAEGDGCSAACTFERDIGRFAYLKASNTEGDDRFGIRVVLSADGSTLAVGAFGESSAAIGIGGDQTNNNARQSGAVYVFTRSGATWSQQAYIKASNTDSSDWFGRQLALSADGSILAVGAPFEASTAIGIGGDQANNNASRSGAVYVFTRSGGTWTQQAYVKASNAERGDEFGMSVALSANGATLAVGAVREGSSATGIDGDQFNNGAPDAGAVYVFTRSGGTWTQQAYVKASNAEGGDRFGESVALAADGSTLVVGAVGEASTATGIDGDQSNNDASTAGAVYVFTRSGVTWTQQTYVKASNAEKNDRFGENVALSADALTLAVGAWGEASAAKGIDGDQANNDLGPAGAVYVFARSGAIWTQQAYVKASNTGGSDEFGWTVALSADGSTLAVGTFLEASAATGIGGNQGDNSKAMAGAVYTFKRSGVAWNQQAYIKASNTDKDDQFGFSVAVSGDGATLAIGAGAEASAATGVGGDQADNSAGGAGAVYVFY